VPRKGPEPDINVTPLVDVVLVLLIIFMVIMPQMEAGMAVNLPGMHHPDGASKGKLEPLLVSLSASGTLYLDKELVDREQLTARLREAHAREPERAVVLKGDKAVRYDEVRALFKQCQELGFPGVSLQVGELRTGVRRG
jgi:biopolymer transport protein ExbD/biopolymer transport protein TolR